MEEIRTEVKTFRVSLQCDTCKEGNMICIKPGVVDGAPTSKHQCDNDDCQAIKWIPGAPYPRIEYTPSTIIQQIASVGSAAKDKLKAVLTKTPMRKKRDTIKKEKL